MRVFRAQQLLNYERNETKSRQRTTDNSIKCKMKFECYKTIKFIQTYLCDDEIWWRIELGAHIYGVALTQHTQHTQK